MRCCGKRALVAAFGQALIKHGRWTNSFADSAAKTAAATDTMGKSSSQSQGTAAAVARRARGRTGCGAAATVSCSEEAFAAGGAERVAELLAGESAGEGAVFYNRVGAINRDLSVLMANVLAEERVRERLAGKKRKKRQIPSTSRPPPADGTLRSRASLADDKTQRGAARSSKGWGVRAFVKGALGRLSRGCWGGDVERVSNNEDQQEEPREDEDGLLVLDAFAASGVRALRCVVCRYATHALVFLSLQKSVLITKSPASRCLRCVTTVVVLVRGNSLNGTRRFTNLLVLNVSIDLTSYGCCLCVSDIRHLPGCHVNIICLSCRYLTEVPGVQRVVANDYDEAAINTIRWA